MIITDDAMAEAAAEMNDAMLRSLPNPDDCHYEFSSGFERKMKRVVRRVEHPIMAQILQSAASIALVLIIGFASVLALSPTVRATVFGWIREQYDSFISYYWADSTPATANSGVYYLDGVPEEYTIVDSSDDVGNHTEVYINPEGNLLYFIYSMTPATANYNVEYEYSNVESVNISGCPADLYISGDIKSNNSIVWYDEEESVIFYLSAVMSKDELISLAESVTPKK